MYLMDSAIAAPPSQSLSLSIQPPGLKSDDVAQAPAMPIDWKWYLDCALMNLAGWLLLFSTLFFLTYYMQEPASHILNSDPAPDMARYGPAPGFDTAIQLVAPPQRTGVKDLSPL